MAVKAVNQLDIVDLTDGYSVVLSSDSVTVVGDKDGKAVANANAFSISVTALCGASVVACTVTATPSTGITAGTATTSNNVVTIPFSVANSLVNSGSVALAVSITNAGVTLNKTVGVAVAKTGATGGTGTRGALWYSGTAITGTSTTPTTFSGSGISSAIVGDMYLNTDTGNTYRCTTAGNASTAKWVYVDNLTGPQGETGGTGAAGADGGRWYTGTGITGTSTTATVFSGSGVANAVVGDMYLNTSTSNYYRCTVAGAPSTAKWVYAGNSKGQQGDPGDDAIVLVIESSAGTIFKNTSAATTLMARVFQGGVELSSSQISALGTVKWYKDGGSTAVSTGLTLAIAAGDVTNKATYVAQLEG